MVISFSSCGWDASLGILLQLPDWMFPGGSEKEGYLGMLGVVTTKHLGKQNFIPHSHRDWAAKTPLSPG